MSDWRKSARDYVAKQQESQKRQQEDRWRRKQQEYKKEYTKELVGFRRKYDCCVCGEPAEPDVVTKPIAADGDYAPSGEVEVAIWTSPHDRRQCTVCGKWACEKHIEAGICKKCALDLPTGGAANFHLSIRYVLLFWALAFLLIFFLLLV